jgi:diguanylate cyclase (GGDEF)-like protein
MKTENIIKDLMQQLYDEYLHHKPADDQMHNSFIHDEMMQLFSETLTFNDTEIEKNYIKLARTFFVKGVPYSQYYDFFSKFTERLLNLASSLPQSGELVVQINHISDVVIDATAQGYLQEVLNHDITTLDKQINETISNSHVIAHWRWLQKVIVDIQYGDIENSVELDSTLCEFGLWLATGEIEEYFGKSEIKQIHQTHEQIHRLGASIYTALKAQRFRNVLMDYLMISRLSLFMVSRLSLKITQKNLIVKAQMDPLTGLKNRLTMMPILEKMFDVHELSSHEFNIAMIDIDHFKNINDTYGHQAGDVVLVELANVLRKTLRGGDLIFRYGGEEFLVIFPHIIQKEILPVLEKLRKTIEKHVFVVDENLSISLTVSVGTATFVPSEPSCTPLELIKKSDEKLYEAKETGRNRVMH